MIFTTKWYNPPKGRNIRSDYLYMLQRHFQDFTEFNDKGVLLRLNADQQSLLNKTKKFTERFPGAKVMVCPGSAWPNKQMTLVGLTDLLQQLRDQRPCHFLFVWGTDAEKEFVQKLQTQFSDCGTILERMPLPVLQNLMGTMHLVVAMDSLPLHLAGTTSVATLSVFGASLAAKYKPEGPRHLSFQGTCPYGRSFEKRCPLLRTCPTGACIHAFVPRLGQDASQSILPAPQGLPK